MTEAQNKPGSERFSSFKNQARLTLLEETTGSTSKNLRMFVDGVVGEDSNNGTEERPFKTMKAVFEKIPRTIKHTVDIVVSPATYIWPTLAAKNYEQWIVVRANESKDVFDVAHSGVAGASTTDSLVETAGINTNDLLKMGIRFLDGPAKGERRLVRNNTTTDIIPVRKFDNAPDPGDSFEVFGANVKFVTPDLSPKTGQTHCWSAGDMAGVPDALGFSNPRGGLVLVNCEIEADASVTTNLFGAGTYSLYGVIGTGGVTVFDGNCKVLGGVDIPFDTWALEEDVPVLKTTKWQGWGYACSDLEGPNLGGVDGNFTGYTVMNGRTSVGDGTTKLLGGYSTLISVLRGTLEVGDFQFFPGALPYIADASAFDTPAVAVAGPDARLNVGNALLSKAAGTKFLVKVDEEAHLLLDLNKGPVVGADPGSTVQVTSKGTLILRGNPVDLGGGGGSMDWDIKGAASLTDKTAFGSNGSAVVSLTEGALVVRRDSVFD